jgi:phosphatidylglycerophosphate synthase
VDSSPPAPGKPKPRDVKGLIAPALRVGLAGPYRAALRFLLWAGAKPDHLTVASLLVSALVAFFLTRGLRSLPAGLLLLSGVLDVFDGAVARARGISSPRGAWFDSVMDRISDALVLGALFYSLLRQDREVDAALALAALAVSLLVSQVRAEAESRGARLGEGAFARAERFIALVVGLWAPGALRYALIALGGLGGFTILQRMLSARTAIGGAERP